MEPLKPKEQKLADDLAGLYYLLGTAVAFLSQFGGKAIVIQAPILSESHVRMARHLPKYYTFLEKMVEYNDFMPIIGAHLGVLAAILTHHDLAPEPAKEHFKMLGAEVAQKVAIMDMVIEQEKQAALNGNTPFAGVPGMATS